MKLLLALIVYLLATVVLGVGLVLAVKHGSLLLLFAGLIGYTLAFAKLGCSTH